jgi:hypothetical protein
MNDGALAHACPIGRTPLPTRSLLVYQATSPESIDDACLHTEIQCTLSGSNVSCLRAASDEEVEIVWQILEVPEGLTVQRSSGSCPGTTGVVPISVVDPTRSVVLSSVRGMGADFDANDTVLASLGSTGNSVALSPPGLCLGYELQVATLTGVVVEAGTVAGFVPGVASGRTVAVGSLAAMQSPVVLTQLAANPAAPSSLPMCHLFARGSVSSSTSLTFTRASAAPQGSCDALASGSLSYQRIDFGTRARVQQLTVVVPRLTRSVTATLPLSVDPTRTLVFFSGMATSGLASGEVADTLQGIDTIGTALATAELQSASSVRVYRGENDAEARFTLYAVEFQY